MSSPTPTPAFTNPFRPGAGHTPPYLAGREQERAEFVRLLQQRTILENMVLTGLRGVGKTVLLESFKPIAMHENWLWVGTDLSESTSISEENIAIRLFTDLSVVTSGMIIGRASQRAVGFEERVDDVERRLDFAAFVSLYQQTPGLVADKLKAVLETTWAYLQQQQPPSATGVRGIIFAYDEAQTLSDQVAKEQFPLSLLLDVFQSIQRKGIPFMLVLTGLPTLFPKLVEARTFAERMFRVVFLDKLTDGESRDAITKPIEDAHCPVRLGDTSVETIVLTSGGYPYFIQFVCREVYDVFLQRLSDGQEPIVPVVEIERKLDTDFFAGRWARVTDRQRELLGVISHLDDMDSEFTVQEIVEKSQQELAKPFSNSHVSQILSALTEHGLVYKNRHGKYSFAVPLLGRFIRRQRIPFKGATLLDL
ncbi:MAG: ATP-binding protein [Gemmatimonadetes bacterium]|nr:ATP-binding protein [Gemmatimonadota bacterium]